MDDETIWGLVRKSLPRLLQCPFSGRVRRYVALQDTSRSEFEHNKHIEQLEATMKSLATVASAWLRTKVAQRGDEVALPPPSSRPQGQYFRTVREDTTTPSLR